MPSPGTREPYPILLSKSLALSQTTLTGVKSGDYTVLVVNLDNNCQEEKTLSIEDESVIPMVAASQSPNTNCPPLAGNGIVNATVINSRITYDYHWYTGTSAIGASEYLGEVWRDREPVDYTVVAIDPNIPTCISAPATIRVQNASKNPIVVINELAPVTNCDPLRPNGVLSAVTENGISGHTFEWYFEGNLYSTGPIASDLGLFTYDLTVINDVTQCRTTLSSGPTNLLGTIPPPLVDILNDRTSCLEPDGTATATVDGSVVDYIFRYYNKFSGDELTNLYENYTIYDLDTSTYLVTAESRKTGCVSDPTEFSIDNAAYFPEIQVIADPSACNEPNGSANVVIGDLTQDFTVTWYGDNGFVAQEKELVYLPVGNYIVEVEGTDGCISTAEAEVRADIVIYNGVSANGDSYNDYFIVLCLELFLNNNVKIYNRAGMLVYEQDGYDMYNPERRFNGVSNRGTSILGTDLPIGTYFYVVDKNDGSTAKVGYLELVR
ncbi:MAG: gliding motility-associated C-terminal domain-containing protein [Cyclobacteriaceae bacterium]|nr:gliding motility-associated C-terminal domain-containing protein [Cyclobacteriaceae bacterium]